MKGSRNIKGCALIRAVLFISTAPLLRFDLMWIYQFSAYGKGWSAKNNITNETNLVSKDQIPQEASDFEYLIRPSFPLQKCRVISGYRLSWRRDPPTCILYQLKWGSRSPWKKWPELSKKKRKKNQSALLLELPILFKIFCFTLCSSYYFYFNDNNPKIETA